jgi:hypothetical protein
MSTRVESTDLGRRRYYLTALQLEAMIEAGVFPEGDDLELRGGVLYKMVKKEPHNFAVAQVADALRRLLPESFHVREEKCLRLSKRSLPEPDVVVAVGRSSTYRPQPPEARDVALLVEVCHHSQKADYHDKYRRYAPLECRRTGSSTSIVAELKFSLGRSDEGRPRDTRNRPGTARLMLSRCFCLASMWEPLL